MLVMRIGTSRSCQLLTHAVQETTCAVATRYSITSSARAQQPAQIRRVGMLVGYAENDPETTDHS